MNRLFVYGIFLDEHMRNRYSMSNPKYATVKDYATFGEQIVHAIKIKNANLSLTGLLVDIEPSAWGRLDRLEAGYSRKLVNTTTGERAYMYVGE